MHTVERRFGANPTGGSPSAQAIALQKGWSASRIALGLNGAVHRSVVSRTLRGKSRNPAVQLLISNFLGVAPRDLFGDDCAPSLLSQPAAGSPGYLRMRRRASDAA